MEINRDKIHGILEKLRADWDMVIRHNTEDEPPRFGMPLPYTVPSVEGMFQEAYYWDTYFTNLGLIRHGRIDLAKNNTECFIHLFKRFGYVPNGNHENLVDRSQPPYLSMMVRDVYDVTGDREWLAAAVETLREEYGFWMTRRATPTGLNRHFHDATDQQCIEFYETIVRGRLGIKTDDPEEQRLLGSHHYAEAETGWDFCPRFDTRCGDFNPIDLNGNLYVYELNFAYFCEQTGQGDPKEWLDRADRRRALVHKYCWDEDRGVLIDYDFVRGQRGAVRSAACLHALYSGLATDEQAHRIVETMAGVEVDYGIVSCEPTNSPITYQWDYPNGWPPQQVYTLLGLEKYGFDREARRIAEKHLSLAQRVWDKTGSLWEKYNVVEGSTKVNDEYPMPPMMGWSASAAIIAAGVLGIT